MVGALLALVKDFLASCNVLSEHFSAEDVIDFNVMRRESVVHEGRWEHDVKAGVPEHGAVLSLEVQEFFGSWYLESLPDTERDEEPDEEA